MSSVSEILIILLKKCEDFVVGVLMIMGVGKFKFIIFVFFIVLRINWWK